MITFLWKRTMNQYMEFFSKSVVGRICSLPILLGLTDFIILRKLKESKPLFQRPDLLGKTRKARFHVRQKLKNLPNNSKSKYKILNLIYDLSVPSKMVWYQIIPQLLMSHWINRNIVKFWLPPPLKVKAEVIKEL